MATKIDLKDKQVNYLFVSTGQETKMYTLCMSYTTRDSNGVVKTNGTGYIKNLSTDYNKAVDKGIEYASRTGFDFRMALDSFDLNPILRGEAAERKLTRAEKKAIAEQERKELVVRQFDVMMVTGVMQIGKHTGLTPREVYERDVSYIVYAASKNDDESVEEFSRFAVNVKLCKEFLNDNPSLFPSKKLVDNKLTNVSPMIGEIGDVIEEATITAIKCDWVNGYYSKSYRIFGVTNKGEYVAIYTNMKKLVSKVPGETFTLLGATVKSSRVLYNENTSVLGGRGITVK